MHFPIDWKSARLALLAAICTCTAPAADFEFGDFHLGPPGSSTLHTGSGRMLTSFFDVFVDVSVPSLPVDSFFDIFYEIELRHLPGPLPPGPPDMVPIELVALQLHAVNPIPIRAGTDTWNMWTLRTGGPTPQQGPTIGQDLGGNMFRIDSFFDVFVELEIPGQPPSVLRSGRVPLTNSVPDGAPTVWLLLVAFALLGTRRLRVGR